MGKEVRGVPEAAPLTPAESIGRYLAGQRRLRGISLDDLALRTRIPLRSLERLESGAFDEQVDGFARSFVRTVAEALGLSPDEAVTRLLSEPKLAEGELERTGRLRRRAGGIAVAALAALVILAGWLLWPRGDAPPTEPDAPPAASGIVTRRDAVRALAEGQNAERAP